jgi:ABC-type transport system involved in multi-copper enzyme maturation permease subunit
MSKAITERPEKSQAPGAWKPIRESAPSTMRADQPGIPRWVGLIGIMLVTIGTIALVSTAAGAARLAQPGIGAFACLLGLAALLFHAFRDTDLQVRRTYVALGYLLVAGGVLVSLLPIKAAVGAHFLPYGFCFLTLGLVFLLPFIRNETDLYWRKTALAVLGVIGVALALTGFIGGTISVNFLLPYSFFLLILGLFFWWAFAGLSSTATELGYRAAQGMAAVGVVFFLYALGRTVLPQLFFRLHLLHFQPAPYLVPTGLLLMGAGAIYALLAFGLCSDNRLVVLTRRELASFFYSPIAYFVLFAFSILAWWQFKDFLRIVINASSPLGGGEPLAEPVIAYYIISWLTVISMIVVVPIITMRLMSEEKRSGSLEVLLTAPVDEISIVVSKFLAVMAFFLVLWVPWGLLLVGLRYLGGEPFDYRPLLSFFIALAATGAGFLSMGLFFSAVTRNQIIAAILTVVAMLPITFLYFLNRSIPADNVWHTVFGYVGYIDLWIDAVKGTLGMRNLVFHASVAIFWLFLTVKVLEARRWS